MVKFGRHCLAFAEESSLYVVPYNEIRNTLIENIEDRDNPVHRQHFEAEWRNCLCLAMDDFRVAMVSLWKLVFDGIKAASSGGDAESVRGALPDTALRLYLSLSNIDDAQELLLLVRQIYNTALTNAEALRKLVKKFDKQHGAELSCDLLPEVYGANFTVGQSTLQAGISLIRASLGLNTDEGADDDAESVGSINSASKQDSHDNQVQRRKEELEWLKGLVKSIAAPEIAHIVAHRGFHSPMDRSDCRPLENSLTAYEAAWTSGVHLCECDITLTKDEKLVLAHDEDFSRLTLDPASPFSSQNVGDLTYRDLISMPLKSGARPPLLIDILRSASAIGGKSQLIIEIKPGNVAAASALARLFLRHPELMTRCAVVMSFDAFAMHSLRKDLKAVLEQTPELGPALPSSSGISLPTPMSLGNLCYRVDSYATSGEQSSMAQEEEKVNGNTLGHQGRTESHDHFGVGLTDSFRTRSDSFSFTPFNQYKQPLQEQGFDHQVLPSLSTSPQPTSALPLRALPLSPRRNRPKLMLLTVADKPQRECELKTSVSDLSQVDHWLGGGDGALDGVYLQFEKEMLGKQGTAALQSLVQKKYCVGVWSFYGRDPDCWESFHHLVREGHVSYVNSDLPKGFKKGGMSRRGVTFGH